MLRSLTVLLTCTALVLIARGQAPPIPHHEQWLYWLTVSYTNSPKNTNPVVVPAGLAVRLTWSNDPASGPVVLWKAKTMNNYTWSNVVGVTNSSPWPLPVKPFVTTFFYGDRQFLSFTGAAPEPPLRFRAYVSTNMPGVVSISSSTDLLHWASAYALLTTTGKNFTITRQ